MGARFKFLVILRASSLENFLLPLKNSLNAEDGTPILLAKDRSENALFLSESRSTFLLKIIVNIAALPLINLTVLKLLHSYRGYESLIQGGLEQSAPMNLEHVIFSQFTNLKITSFSERPGENKLPAIFTKIRNYCSSTLSFP